MYRAEFARTSEIGGGRMELGRRGGFTNRMLHHVVRQGGERKSAPYGNAQFRIGGPSRSQRGRVGSAGVGSTQGRAAWGDLVRAALYAAPANGCRGFVFLLCYCGVVLRGPRPGRCASLVFLFRNVLQFPKWPRGAKKGAVLDRLRIRKNSCAAVSLGNLGGIRPRMQSREFAYFDPFRV